MLTKKRNFMVATLGIFLLGALFTNGAYADQFVGHHQGREVVVHSNPIPVFLHRLVPPNYGRHMTIREYHASRHAGQRSTAQFTNLPR